MTSSGAPRVSIVVAIEPADQTTECGSRLAAFEATLISVLENRPSDAEVIVCHDGSYDDPFDLCDEVVFAVPTNHDNATKTLTKLWRTGVDVAKAPVVHLISGGCQVNLGWTDSAANHFENERCGVVAGFCQNRTETPVAIVPGIRQPVRFAGGKETDLAMPLMIGSFWRRELLRSILAQPLSNLPELALSIVAVQSAIDAGWKVSYASECLIDRKLESIDQPNSYHAVQCEWIAGGWSGLGESLFSCLVQTVLGLGRPSQYAAFAKRWIACLWSPSVLDQIEPNTIFNVSDFLAGIEEIEAVNRAA